MKKIVLFFATIIAVFSILGCVNMETTAATTTAAATTNATTAAATTTGSGTTAITTVGTTAVPTTTQLVVSDLPDEEVEITFWHIYGSDKSALLDKLIEEFEAMYPNVTITSTSQTDYNTLREKINMGISVEQMPTLAVGYPDHFAGYINAGAGYKLDNFIYSNKAYEITDSSSSIFGDIVPLYLDLDDFVPSYLEENNQYEGGYYYSVPFSKSTESVAVNTKVLKAHVAEIRALGITISDEGYLSHSTALTYAQLEALQGVLVDTNGTNTTTNKCEYLLNYDSAANMFINMSRQFRAPYTNSSGQILIDNDTTKSMLNYIQEVNMSNTITLPIVWEQDFGSLNFKYGDACMTVTSTAGVSYNIPTASDVQANLQFGIFDVDFIQIPQFVANEGDQFTVNIEGVNQTFTGSLSAVQQGPNIGIFADASTNEKLFAWLFIKYLIETDNTSAWAMNTGYLPARLSSYTSDSPIALTSTFSTTYKDFLKIAQDFWAADGDVDWVATDERWDYLPSSMVANIAMYQSSFFQYDPAFGAGSNSAGSATARVEAGYCLERAFVGAIVSGASYDPEVSLNTMINQLTW